MTVYIGIDWSESKHDVAYLNPAGAQIARLSIPHSPQGFAQFVAKCQQLGFAPGACQIALETAHNLVIDFLWSQGFSQIYVVPPSQVKANRGRLAASGAHDDPRDALLLADILRTDRGRQQPWHPDGLLVRQMRAQVSLIEFLTRNQLRYANRLRSLLVRYYPAALEVFGELTAQIALQFIRRYPSPQAAARLSLTQFTAFTEEHRYSHPRQVAQRFACLQAPYPQANLDTVAVYQEQSVLLAELLLPLVQHRLAVQRQLAETFRQHPDAAIFSSLPGTGSYLAPALLAHFGDDRQRFPSAAALQALAGTCPVTEQSGKSRGVRFRTACDHQFRHIVQQWARETRSQSAWAAAYYERVRPHCSSDSHATRCLANRWLAVAWKLWHARQPYDEAYHTQQHLARSQPRR